MEVYTYTIIYVSAALPGCVDDVSLVECDVDLLVVVVDGGVLGGPTVQMIKYEYLLTTANNH